MKKHEVDQYNILIAEFMSIPSYEWRSYTIFVYEDNNHRMHIDLHYHDSWEWLMEVVNKINSFEENGVFTYGVIIAPEACVIERPTQYGNIENEHGATLIEMVYLTIVEFIEWYNKEVKK